MPIKCGALQMPAFPGIRDLEHFLFYLFILIFVDCQCVCPFLTLLGFETSLVDVSPSVKGNFYMQIFNVATRSTPLNYYPQTGKVTLKPNMPLIVGAGASLVARVCRRSEDSRRPFSGLRNF